MALIGLVIACGLVAPRQWHSDLTRILGELLVAVSLLTMLAGVAALGRGLTPFPRPKTETRLVQSGIYSLVRHPLYSALFVGAVGWSLLRESSLSLGASVLLMVLLYAKARREEAWLAERFPEYTDYAKRVARFIPYVF